MRDVLRAARRAGILLGPDLRWRWAVLALLALLVTGVEVIGASAIYALLALVGDPNGGGAPIVAGPLSAVLPTDLPMDDLRNGVAAGIVAFFLIRTALVVGRAYLEGRTVAGMSVRVAERLLDGYLRLPYRFHTRRSSAELIRNTHESTQRLQAGVLRPLVMLTSEGLLLIGLSVMLVVSDPPTAITAFVALALTVLGVQHLLRPRMRIWGRLAQEATTGSLESLQQALGGIRDVKLLGRESEFVAAHRRHRLRLARSNYLSMAGAEAPRALIELGLVTTVVVAYLVGVSSDAGTSISTLGLFAYAGLRMQPSLQRVVTAINAIRYHAPLVDDLIEEDRQIRMDAAVAAGVPPSVVTRGHALIELSGVVLDYDPGDPDLRPALGGVDLTIAPGEFVGICGPTGGGKSTLLDVLVGLLQPTAGEVRVDGMPLGPRPTWWWQRLGVVSQAVFLTDDTLRRNIAFGVARDEVEDVRLTRCLAQAQLTDLVAELPDGLDTVVGERGIRLSGGQRQRVAIARALYRDPSVLVLDEGTSALDGATEAAVIRALEGRAYGRTLIAVAHRLATIRHADRIIVLAEGRIAAEGTWDQLISGNALFRDLAGGSADRS